jgi:hypothetical protein
MTESIYTEDDEAIDDDDLEGGSPQKDEPNSKKQKV